MNAVPSYRDEEASDRFDNAHNAMHYIADQLGEDITRGDGEERLKELLHGEDTRDAPGELAADTDEGDGATLFSDGWDGEDDR